tara:strand:- start:295 stop:510 length:216 start_codon:yes stop_codon:yes gene_type:complete
VDIGSNNKIKSNTRGDSGLSDSGLQRSQNFFLEKHKSALDKIENYGRIEMNRRKPSKKKSLWNRIRSWFSK